MNNVIELSEAFDALCPAANYGTRIAIDHGRRTDDIADRLETSLLKWIKDVTRNGEVCTREECANADSAHYASEVAEARAERWWTRLVEGRRILLALRAYMNARWIRLHDEATNGRFDHYDAPGESWGSGGRRR